MNFNYNSESSDSVYETQLEILYYIIPF